MKLFAIFGILCVTNSNISDHRKCMNFWEDPVIKYNKQECIKQVQKRGDMIEQKFKKQGLYIETLEIYCLPVD